MHFYNANKDFFEIQNAENLKLLKISSEYY